MGSSAPGACDFCGRSLSESDFRSGRALVLIKKAFCHDCAEKTLQKSKTARKTTAGGRISADPAAPPSPAPRKVALGEHACGFPATDAERRAQMLAFVRDGLRAGERVYYAVDGVEQDRVREELENDGLDVERLQEKGQLKIHPAAELFGPEGRFEVGPTLVRVKALVDRARQAGYPGVRLLSEMSWALRGWPGSEAVGEYELKLNGLFPELRCAALCQYDATRFSLPHLRSIQTGHPVVVGALRD